MDSKIREEIMRAFERIKRQSRRVTEQTVEFHSAISGAASPMSAFAHIYDVRHVIWLDGDEVWERIKAVIHDDKKRIVLMHQVIETLSHTPETYGKLRTKWFKGDASARATAKVPYAMMQKKYAEAGEFAALHAGQLMLDTTTLLALNYPLEAVLQPLLDDGHWVQPQPQYADDTTAD